MKNPQGFLFKFMGFSRRDFAGLFFSMEFDVAHGGISRCGAARGSPDLGTVISQGS